jgi:hypothetical protein
MHEQQLQPSESNALLDADLRNRSYPCQSQLLLLLIWPPMLFIELHPRSPGTSGTWFMVTHIVVYRLDKKDELMVGGMRSVLYDRTAIIMVIYSGQVCILCFGTLVDRNKGCLTVIGANERGSKGENPEVVQKLPFAQTIRTVN